MPKLPEFPELPVAVGLGDAEEAVGLGDAVVAGEVGTGALEPVGAAGTRADFATQRTWLHGRR